MLDPSGEPRATGHIPEIVALIQRLIDSDHAYASGGDVYFDVRSHPAYGELSGQRPDAMLPSEDAGAKRDTLDFALWKGAKPGEPFWETPWGPGRPGWHIECSAMATKYLGPVFDIHGGGLDLVFPHHENELAQSTAVGDGFARFWLHNGMLNTDGEKMSKSLGNSLFVPDLLAASRAPALRYALAAPHYRSDSEWSEQVIAEADAAYSRIEGFIQRATERFGSPAEDAAVPAAFTDAMDDDLAVPVALGEVHDAVRRGNSALADGHEEAGRQALADVAAMTRVLGLWPGDFANRLRPTRACSGLSRRSCRRCSRHVRRRASARTSSRATGSGTRWLRPEWSSRTPRRAPAGTWADGRQEGPEQGHRRSRPTQARGPRPDSAGQGATQAPGRTQGQGGREALDRDARADRPGVSTTSRLGSRRCWSPAATPSSRRCAPRCPAKTLYVAVGLDHDDRISESKKLAATRGIGYLDVTRTELDRIAGGAPHQGIALAVRPFEYTGADDLLRRVLEEPDPPLIVALDGVTDPHNLGAIARSAAAFGAHGLIIPERRAVGVTPAAWKASAGTLARLPVARVTNLVRTLKSYAEAGLMLAGLDGRGEIDLDALELASGPLILVVGAEGKGLSRLVAADLRPHGPDPAELVGRVIERFGRDRDRPRRDRSPPPLTDGVSAGARPGVG